MQHLNFSSQFSIMKNVKLIKRGRADHRHLDLWLGAMQTLCCVCFILIFLLNPWRVNGRHHPQHFRAHLGARLQHNHNIIVILGKFNNTIILLSNMQFIFTFPSWLHNNIPHTPFYFLNFNPFLIQYLFRGESLYLIVMLLQFSLLQNNLSFFWVCCDVGSFGGQANFFGQVSTIWISQKVSLLLD